MKQKTYDVIVVGGGAAGLMAAIHAASGGAHTAILDHHEVSGKKILATGNGKCNFTNLMQGESYYRCDTPAVVLHILEQFSAEDTIAFFRELGVMTRDRQGYCYPRSGQASAIRNALLRKAEKLGIEIHNGIGIRKIIRENNRFSFDTKSGSFFSTCCILATGGMASPKSGSDGSGYIYAKSFGHTVKKPLPALTALMAEANWLKETTGVRADATVKLYVDGSCVAEDTGEVQKVEMKDDVTKVQISKTDISGKELPGAKLTILDKDGKTVESWTSEEKPHYIEMLPIGEYTLREETAPDGYLVAEDVKFTVKDTGEIQKVVMKDEVKPTETPTETPAETPETTSTPETKDTETTKTSTSPKTGDNTPILFWILLAGVGMAGVGGTVILRKKKKK